MNCFNFNTGSFGSFNNGSTTGGLFNGKNPPNVNDLNNFNSFLMNANNQLICDQACQEQKQAALLKEVYLNAQANAASAPQQLDTAEKNYLDFTEGPDAYTELEEKNFTAKAQEIVKNFTDTFNKNVDDVKNDIHSYSSLFNNSANVYELYLTYKDEFSYLKTKLINESSDVNTNNRKTYYENQQIEFLDFFYYYVLLVVYIIVAVGYAVFAFIYPSPYDWKIRLAVLVFLIILPFISTWLMGLIVNFGYKIYNALPKNVYPTL